MSIGEVDSLQKDADNQVGVGLVKVQPPGVKDLGHAN
jgi:hypothetical protein